MQRREAIKVYFINVTKTDFQTNKDFWILIKLFLTERGFLENTEVKLAEEDKIVTEEKGLVRIFNGHYINIVEHPCGTKPTNFTKEWEIKDNKRAVEEFTSRLLIMKEPRLWKNNIENYLTAGNSHLLKIFACDVEKRLRNLDGKKSTDMDEIPPKLIKLSAKVLSNPLVIVIDSVNKRLSPDNSMSFYLG